MTEPDAPETDRELASAVAAATETIDAVFPAERLARQRARILEAVAADGRPGQLVRFPAVPASARRATRARPSTTMRWVAAAAAAAFIVGLFAGQHLPRDLRTLGPVTSARPVKAVPPRLAAPPRHDADAAILAEIEAAGGRGGPALLRRIDAVTPHVWDVPR